MWNFRKWLIENYKQLEANNITMEAFEATKAAYAEKTTVQAFSDLTKELEKAWVNSVRAKNAMEHGNDLDTAIECHKKAYEAHKAIVVLIGGIEKYLSSEKLVIPLRRHSKLNRDAASLHRWASINLQNHRGDNDIDWRPTETIPEDLYAA